MRQLKFWHTIRFRLAVTYSLVILFCFLAFLGLFNLYMRAYFLETPREQLPANINIIGGPVVERFSRLQAAEQQRILEIRRRDLQRIQTISLVSILPITFISIAAGYLLSGNLLNPLRVLQQKITNRNIKNLAEPIRYEGPPDEVSSIIDSFNEMSIKLHRAFQDQEEFIQDASHELKTPLAIQQANLELLLDKYKKNSLEYKSIDNALNGIERMRKLTADLLSLSEPLDAERKNLNLAQMTEDVVSNLQPLAHKHNVNLVNEVTQTELVISANYYQLHQALSNVIENGIKYAAQSKTKRVVVRMESDNHALNLSISDTGPGIPTEAHQKIFQRFYRFDESRNNKTGGNGLGLAIVKKIIDAHGYKIEFESSHTGTTFIISMAKA